MWADESNEQTPLNGQTYNHIISEQSVLAARRNRQVVNPEKANHPTTTEQYSPRVRIPVISKYSHTSNERNEKTKKSHGNQSTPNDRFSCAFRLVPYFQAWTHLFGRSRWQFVDCRGRPKYHLVRH